MKLKQISVFLENKPGALSAPCRLLARAGINIQTFALADTEQFGILRLIVANVGKAQRLLQREGFVVKVTEIVVLAVPDRPGGLAMILDALEGWGVNLEYCYAFTNKFRGHGLLAFRFDQPDAAIKALKPRGIDTVGTKELTKRLES